METVALVPLTNSRRFALVDTADYPLVEKYSWALVDGWVVASGLEALNGPEAKRMSAVLCGKPVGCKNGDRLDNRRENLKLEDLLKLPPDRFGTFRIPLRGTDLYAVADEDDRERIEEASEFWRLVNGQVVSWCPSWERRPKLVLAKLILRLGSKKHCFYADGSPLNLSKRNVKPGAPSRPFAQGAAAEAARAEEAARPTRWAMLHPGEPY